MEKYGNPFSSKRHTVDNPSANYDDARKRLTNSQLETDRILLDAISRIYE